MAKLLLRMAAVGVLHCVIGLVFYRELSVHKFDISTFWVPFDEWMVFGFPAALACVLYGSVFWRSGYLRGMSYARFVTLCASLATTMLSFSMTCLKAFNLWGT